MATIHLVCGPAGAGKTTYALELCREIGAAHFSIDEWMVTLFSADAPTPPNWTWISERIARCEAQILSTALQLGGQNVSSVLDLSFLRATDRQRVAQQVRAAGLSVRLHVLRVDTDERWRRVEARNATKGETYRVTVTRPMFNFIDTIWEEPTAAEMAEMKEM